MNAAVFLDVNEFVSSFNEHSSDSRSIATLGEAVARLLSWEFSVVLVATETGSAGERDKGVRLNRVHQVVLDELLARGAAKDRVFCCSLGQRNSDSSEPCMLLDQAISLDVDVSRSWMIGQTTGVTLLGREAGCRGTFLVGEAHESSDDDEHHSVDFFSTNTAEAVERIGRIYRTPVEASDPWDWLPRPSDEQPPPFFIVGAERSGTTLLRLILSSHPELACHEEFEYVVDWLDPETGSISLSKFRDHLTAHRCFSELFRQRGSMLKEPQVVIDHAALVRAFLEQFRREQNRPIVGATVHRHFDHLLRIWPNARFVHLVRDPRDVARSNIKMGWAGTSYHGVEEWLKAEHLWENVVATIDSDRWVEIQYEQLIEAPQEELTRICRLLGTDYSEAMLDYHKTSTYESLDPAMTRQWTRKMRPYHIQLVETRVSEMLADRGYEPSGHPPIRVSSLEQRRLRVVGRFKRWRWRLDRYGFGLMFRHLVARKLGLKTMRDNTRRAMHDIDDTHVK